MEILVVFCVLGTVLAKIDIEPCSASAKDFPRCTTVLTQKVIDLLSIGVPELNVPKIEPFEITSITVGSPDTANAVNIYQSYDNVKIWGISKCKVVSGDITGYGTQNLQNYVVGIVPKIKVEADYEISGRVLLLPITGKGKAVYNLDNVKVTYNATTEAYRKKGRTYMKIKDFYTRLEPEFLEINLDNLFNGDERLGKEMNRILNENWKPVYADMKKPYEEVTTKYLTNFLTRIFSHIPLEAMIVP